MADLALCSEHLKEEWAVVIFIIVINGFTVQENR